MKALAAAALALGTIAGWLTRDVMLLILFLSASARAFETPTMHALVPGIVPPELLPRAIAASATANQTAIICGPALGGLLYVFGAATVYLTCTAVFVLASALVSLIRLRAAPAQRLPFTAESVFAGIVYIWRHRVVLGAISLDLFAMLLGGVTALLPIYAKDVLATGPWGLGLLRSAPALGALAISVLLARRQIEHRVGQVLFTAIGVFGAAAIVFAFSTSLVVSILALAVYGAADAVSVVIRHSLVQTRTPNDMLGRVMAANSMFTGTSGTLGEFRAGTVAALFGAFASVLVGGVGAVLIALLWMRLFPEIARMEAIRGMETEDARSVI
jgi:MFS family permease